MTIREIPYSYQSYSHHIRIDYDRWDECVRFMWNRYPENPSRTWRTFAGTVVAVNDEKLALELMLRFG